MAVHHFLGRARATKGKKKNVEHPKKKINNKNCLIPSKVIVITFITFIKKLNILPKIVAKICNIFPKNFPIFSPFPILDYTLISPKFIMLSESLQNKRQDVSHLLFSQKVLHYWNYKACNTHLFCQVILCGFPFLLCHHRLKLKSHQHL